MSKVTSRLCDRCKAVVLSGGAVLTVCASEKLDSRFPTRELDLCGPCSDRFAAFMKEKP